MGRFRTCHVPRQGRSNDHSSAFAKPIYKDETMTEDANSAAKVAANDAPVATASDGQSRDRKTLRLTPNYQRQSTGRSPLFRQ